MKFRKASGAATAPQTSEQVTLTYKANIGKLANELSVSNKTKSQYEASLPKLSKELYGTEMYQTASPRNIWGTLGYLIILGIVAGVEIPVNSGGFEIFGRSQTATTFTAIAFGLFTAALAHFGGHSFKRSSVEKKNKQSGAGMRMVGVVCCVIAFGLFWFIAGFRMAYFQDMGLEKGLDQITQTLFTFAIFMGGVIVAFKHASNVKDLDKAKTFKNELKGLKRMEKTIEKLHARKEKFDEKYAIDLPKAKYAEEQKKLAEQQQQQAGQRQAQLQEEQSKKEAEQKLTAFNELLQEFSEKFNTANAIYQVTEDKDQLAFDDNFATAKGRMEILIEEMEKFPATDIDGGEAQLKQAKDLLSTLTPKND